MSRKTERSKAYWRDFVQHSGVDADEYAVCNFGDSPGWHETGDRVFGARLR